MINILLAEDHNVVRNGLKMLLEADKDLNITGEAINGQQVLDLLEGSDQVDVVLSDINMPLVDGISLITELKNRGCKAKVIILTMHENEQYVHEAFREGAFGYLMKSAKEEELVYAIKHVYSGGYYLCSELAMIMLKKNMHSTLHLQPKEPLDIDFTEREIEVLQLIAEGLTNQQMSDKLFLSKRTIEGHRQSLIDKTEAPNTAGLISFALRNGVID
ncbi:response regulator transcription factor [Pedobacter steynii]|uniref:DNA-binding response regulator n=1 Tax=Pedobacter steynii TaxID=430522 RepID=A0A1D7QLU0_9SPHI|nr:response regulator transcription factor [Pedobacter steynii]AOM79641.1 DNA-binding response regulator [Pedobacter steynii]